MKIEKLLFPERLITRTKKKKFGQQTEKNKKMRRKART